MRRARGRWPESRLRNVECFQCRKIFQRTVGNIRFSKLFCSRSCQWQDKSIQPQPQLHTPEAIRAKNLAHRGAANGMWKGGITLGENIKVYRNAYIKRRRAQAYKAGGKHTAQEWASLKGCFGNRCLGCWRPEAITQLTEDHIVPLSRGGSDDISNIQPLCRSCNSRKHTALDDFRPIPYAS